MVTDVTKREFNNKTSNFKQFYISIELINEVLIYVFVFNVIFIPNDTFNLKIISLLILLVLNVNTFLNSKGKDEKIILYFGFILISLTIIWSIFLTRNLSNISLGYPGYILLLYTIIKRNKIDFGKIFIRLLKLLAYVSLFMVLLDLFGILDMNRNPVLMWFMQSGNAMVGKGSHLPIYYMVFFKTSPLLFIGLYDCLKTRHKLDSLVFIFSIIFSGTRANILMLFIAIIFYFCLLQRNKKARFICSAFLLIIIVFLLIEGSVLNFFIDMFNRKADSDATREGHLAGIFEYWQNNPLNFIIGSGFSSEFYSYGLNAMTSNIELSYWNLLRQVGLLLFIPMMIMYLYPVSCLIKSKRNIVYVFAYLIYLIIAYTNPFLYSSTGLTLLLFMYWLCFRNDSFKNFNSKRS